MNTLLRGIAAACLSVSLSACAGTVPGQGLDSIISFIDSPSTQQAIASLNRVSTAIVCDISGASGLASSVASDVKTKASVQGSIDTVATGSRAVCAALGGVATGATVSNAVAITAVGQ